MEKNQSKAYFFAISAVLLWSTVASAFKLSLAYFDALNLLLYASSFSLCVFFCAMGYQHKFYILFLYSKKTYFKLALLGLINPFIYYLVLFRAYELLPAQEAQPINYTWALTLTYLSVFILKQKISVYDFLAGLICYFGVLIISTHGDLWGFSFYSLTGVFLALFSTVLWSLYWIYNTKLHVDPLVGLFINFLFGVPAILFYALITSHPLVFNIHGFLGSAYVGIFEMGITFILWLQAMKLSTNTAKIANLIFISPFLSLVFISIFVGEVILFSTYIGLIFIIIGLLLQQRVKKVDR
ncbi:permease of the drug/metabolite transporter (DMT) superfamily [Sulfurospirillum diekertiae]|uniref:Permease of the drug/metabolite transporter (DMT) superfamily n=1 Tax=Sulfurospirillum diekertiae TaxID=1854492 RepID=A0A290HXT1_9BACT|nr:DMT family transporter [Sulfurospirillum diekertiae]ATB70179.1 permease of the drug/metabolite transporter (DMT) superfamily [Sulfurospirillum diekertiae]